MRNLELGLGEKVWNARRSHSPHICTHRDTLLCPHLAQRQRLPVVGTCFRCKKVYLYSIHAVNRHRHVESMMKRSWKWHAASTCFQHRTHFERGFKVVILVAGACQNRRNFTSHLFICQAFGQQAMNSV